MQLVRVELDPIAPVPDARRDQLAGDLDGPVARTVVGAARQGQRVVFDLDDTGRATALRLGSEVDMATPGFPPAVST